MDNERELVEVRIGGVVHNDWTSYELDSDLLVPADAWRVQLSASSIELPPSVVAGAKVVVALTRNGKQETVLSGTLDSKRRRIRRGQHDLILTGRDGAGVLLDCAAPIFTVRSVPLGEVIAKIVKALGVLRIRIEAENEGRFLQEKVVIQPGDTAWDALRRASEANGLWPWFEPDGTLVVGGPNYSAPPVAQLVLRKDGNGNNIIELDEDWNMSGRYSEVTVLGQSTAVGYGAGERDGRHNIRGAELDTGVVSYRPMVLVDHEATSEAIARARGRKFISDSRVKGYTLHAVVAGHRTAQGLLWKPGQRVHVLSEPHGLNGVYFLMARRFSGDRRGGQITSLTLKEDGAWVLDAHPSKRKHRRGKNSLPGRVVDLTQGALAAPR